MRKLIFRKFHYGKHKEMGYFLFTKTVTKRCLEGGFKCNLVHCLSTTKFYEPKGNKFWIPMTQRFSPDFSLSDLSLSHELNFRNLHRMLSSYDISQMDLIQKISGSAMSVSVARYKIKFCKLFKHQASKLKNSFTKHPKL